MTCLNKNGILITNYITRCYKMVKNIFLFLGISTLLFSCANTTCTYFPDYVISKPKKTTEQIAFYRTPPNLASVKIGTIAIDGNGFANNDDLIISAKEKAAEQSGDYILVEDAGVNTQTIYNPGHTNYNADASWGNSYGNYQANGYSVGPSITTVNRPWARFSVWVFAPSHLGLKTDNLIITGFNLNSSAETSGLQIGDIILGIDDIDIQDNRLVYHMLEVQPGQTVKVSVSRNNQRVDYTVKAMPNI